MSTKALSLLLFFQMKVDGNQSECYANGITHNRISNFSYNKIKRVTGLHIATIKKRLATAERNGWVVRVGNDLMICSKAIKSSHNRNNYTVGNDFKRITDLQDWLLAHIIVNIQEAKEFVKDTFGRLKDPKTLKEYKRARRTAQERYPEHTTYVDNGISYRCLVMNLGVGKTKLKSLLRFAEENDIIHRHRNIQRVGWLESIFYKELDSQDCLIDYLKLKYGRLMHYFFTNKYAYLCFANTYSVHTGTY